MYFLIYKITNTLNEKFYIGKHKTDTIEDGYMGSGVALKAAYKKYGKEFFRKEILHYCDTESDMYALERRIVNEDMINDPKCYNMRIGGEGGFSREEALRGSQLSCRSEAFYSAMKERRGIPNAKWANDKEYHKQISSKGGQASKEKTKGTRISEETLEKRRKTLAIKKPKGNTKPRFIYTIQHPDGMISTISNLTNFCRDVAKVPPRDNKRLLKKGYIILNKEKVD